MNKKSTTRSPKKNSNAGPQERPENIPGYAVAVLVVSPRGIPLIRDPKKPAPVFWKAPGGRSRFGETAESAAVRELREEIGLDIPENELSLVFEEDRGSHVLSLFAAKLASLPQLKQTGDEGEEIHIFSPAEILAMRDFFPNHRAAYGKILTETARKK